MTSRLRECVSVVCACLCKTIAQSKVRVIR
jgi:hypothetical protein